MKSLQQGYEPVDVSSASFHPAAEHPRRRVEEAEPEELAFDRTSLAEGRRRVFWFATHAGLGARRSGDLVLAVNELLTNSVRHGGGSGILRLWLDDRSVCCEVRDRGRIADPRIVRSLPQPDQTGGRGLWIVHRLCDHVHIRSSDSGTVVRVSMRRR